MRKTEQRLWDRMRAGIAPQRVRLERVENLVGVGIPDVLALAQGAVTLCELKAITAAPRRAATQVFGPGKGLNQDQRNWHLDWHRHGGRSLVVASVAELLFVVPGSCADYFNNYNLAELTTVSVARSWKELMIKLETK